ncbi:MAG: hypothetical protein QXV17_03020 [Candidatus Micrarchaeaceae archaeon]
MIMAINRIIQPESIDLLDKWYKESYINVTYRADVSFGTLSRIMNAIGVTNSKCAFLKEILKIT